ncbi:hypothetical protein EYF80_014916 [Liparis tanakae]|uniref:Uncharacterized protein n=1 Tax=Liparis tanakae TaxID=230148 RepID=A0A4Z2I9W2_9TELE|nr:hypothetical protein EYF80_014916 [Liparis tanakae]
MVYQEVWSNAAVGQQERGGEAGWVGAQQKGARSGADTLPTPAPALPRGFLLSSSDDAQDAGNAAVTSRNLFRFLWISEDVEKSPKAKEARACSSLLRGFASPSKVSSDRLTQTPLTARLRSFFRLFGFSH